MKLRMKIILGMAALLSAACGWGGQSAQADGEGLAAMKSAPQGLQISQYFTVPATLGAKSLKNSATVLANSGSSSNLPMDGVQISTNGDKDTGGAVWSSGKTFDLNRNQRASMWVYISATDPTSMTEIGDGMAFVLQNDDAQAQDGKSYAFSGTGESLGVWGVDPHSTKQNAIASTAIQKSWAMEFDTHMNDTISLKNGLFGWDVSKDVPNYFDKGDGTGNGYGYNPVTGNQSLEGIKGQHIASGYPAADETYVAQGPESGYNSLPIMGQYYYYSQNHYGLLRDSASIPFIGNGQWHHITVDYTAPTGSGTDGTMYYKFDDKNPQTGSVQATPYEAKVSIDTSKLGVTRSDGHVYWGFTGSTGAGTETALVVFEQVPDQIEASASAEMMDTTQNKQINDNESVNANDDVQLTYRASYQDGNVNWRNILAKLQLPKDVSFSKATAQIDGEEERTISLANMSNNTLSESIGDLNATARQATVTLTGTVNNVSSKTKDTTNASQFVGDNGLASATLPAFNIEPTDLALKLDEASKDQTVNLGAATGATISGNLKLSNSALANSALTIYGAFDGSGNSVKEAATITGTGDTRAFSLKVPQDQLTATPNPHTLALFVSDGNGAMSAPTTATIRMGQVVLGDTTTPLTFTPTFLSGKTQTIKRDGDWSLNVKDSLKSDSTWQLTAQTAGMFKDGVNAPGNELNGHLVYQATPTADPQPLGAAAVPIYSGKSDGTTQTTNIADGWDDSTGILLRIDGSAVQGDYSGEIQWTLTAAP